MSVRYDPDFAALVRRVKKLEDLLPKLEEVVPEPVVESVPIPEVVVEEVEVEEEDDDIEF